MDLVIIGIGNQKYYYRTANNNNNNNNKNKFKSYSSKKTRVNRILFPFSQVTSESACRLACEIENEFLCRSFIFKGPPVGTAYNCELFHLDHKTLPDGPSTYLNAERPLIDDGQKIGNYYENYCESELVFYFGHPRLCAR
jgi:hypothetical protein